jgi:hypothetical protein
LILIYNLAVHYRQYLFLDYRVGQAIDQQPLQQQNNTLQELIHGEICQKARPVGKGKKKKI